MRDVSEKNVYANSKKPNAVQSVREKKNAYADGEKPNAVPSVRRENAYAKKYSSNSASEKSTNASVN